MQAIENFLTLRTKITHKLLVIVWLIFLIGEVRNIWNFGALLYNSISSARIYGQGPQNVMYVPIFTYWLLQTASTIAWIAFVGVMLKLAGRFLTDKSDNP